MQDFEFIRLAPPLHKHKFNFDLALDSLWSAHPTSYTLSWFFRKCDEMISFWPNRACTVPAWSWV